MLKILENFARLIQSLFPGRPRRPGRPAADEPLRRPRGPLAGLARSFLKEKPSERRRRERGAGTRRRFVVLLIATGSVGALHAQAINYDYIGDPYIKTVMFRVGGSPTTLPIADLKAKNGALTLTFDYLGGEVQDYVYSIQHYNANWEPSELTEAEYIEGFNGDRILDIANSLNTLMPYTQYTLSLPNRFLRWTKSGNYTLTVYTAEDRKPVLVRRFLVSEPVWRTDAALVRPAMVGKSNTHHEIDFTVLTPQNNPVRVVNGMNEVKAVVLQNKRWNTALGPLTPLIADDRRMVFDFQDKIVFPAGKEWRFFDIRTFDFRGEGVAAIQMYKQLYYASLIPDNSREGGSYDLYNDINGSFVIDNRNFNQSLLQCDYARVRFTLRRNLPFDDEEVYVFGEMSDFQIKPEFRMRYVAEEKAYVCEPLLKQGYYNYQYVVVNPTTGKIDPDGVEGNNFETENSYAILVYHRGFGLRYDRLVSVTNLKSGIRQ